MSARSLRIAVIQPDVAVGKVAANRRRLADLVGLAVAEHDPGLVLLPECATTKSVAGPEMRAAVEPVDGPTLALLRDLARRHGCAVGGGFPAKRGAHARGTYALVDADGGLHLHDKDQPSLWDNHHYTAGTDDGFCYTPLGAVGLACGFEWARSRTAARLRGSVRLVAGGSCWWSYPEWRLTSGWLMRREHDYNVTLAREMVGRLARMVGAPTAIAQHVGRFTSPMIGLPLRWPTHTVGLSQICERDGRVLARLDPDDGESWTAADVVLDEPEPLDPVPAGFWSAPIPASLHAAWALQNLQGRLDYRCRYRRGEFPWQALPDADLPDHVPAPAEPEASASGTVRAS